MPRGRAPSPIFRGIFPEGVVYLSRVLSVVIYAVSCLRSVVNFLAAEWVFLATDLDPEFCRIGEAPSQQHF